MPQKLVQGDRLPSLTLRLIDGGTLTLPEALPGRYLALLFYRGHWCPYCRRQLQAYQEHLAELTDLGVSVVAAAVDSLEDTQAMAEHLGLTYPVAYGVTDDQLTEFDPWYADDQHGHYVQPMELLVLRGGTIFGAMYATGPIGRMAVDEVLNSVRGRERRRLEREQAESAPPPTEAAR
jgi:peroxiredoxin